MSDLSNLLGDLYGDSSTPDGPPVRREPAAAERIGWSAERPDDDLAAALSAALADAEPAAYAAPAPVAPVMPAVPAPAAIAPAPVLPAPAPVLDVPAASWTSSPAPEPMTLPVSVPAAVMQQGPRMWELGDDDISPMGGLRSKKRK